MKTQPTMTASTRTLAAALIGAAGLALPALAQESVAGAEGESEVSNLGLEAGPQDLPGRPESPRGRPPTDAPEEPLKLEPRDWFGGKPYWEWSNAFGDLGGLRTAMSDFGLTIAGSYALTWSSVWDGGISNKASTRTLLDINATLNMEKAFSIKGGTIFADFYSTANRGGSRDAGDIQSFDNNATGDNVDELAELWYEQKLFDNVLRIKAGKMEANTDFNAIQCNGAFIHLAAGLNTSMFTFPTYPETATGVLAFLYPTENTYIGVGFFDGSLGVGKHTGRNGPRSLFKGSEYYVVAEGGLNWSELGALGPGRISVGGWFNTSRFTRFDSTVDRTTEGGYIIVEQQLLARAETADDATKGFFAFLRYGHADDAIASIGNNVAGGLVLNGTLPGRNSDSTGVFVSYADLSDDAAATFPEDETAIELYYRFAVTPFLAITPDLQYIINPSGSSSVDNALVGSLRVEVSF